MEKPDEVVHRIGRLERAVWIFKLIALGATATLGVILLVNVVSPPSPEIVAERPSIVDPQGKPAIVLSATAAGSFIWWYSEGSLRGSVTASRDSTFLELYTANGRESRVELRVDKENGPVLLMLDPYNIVRLQMTVNGGSPG